LGFGFQEIEEIGRKSGTGFPTNRQLPTATVSYNHACFPAHQVIVNGTMVYSYHPPREDPTYIAGCLFLHQNMTAGQTNPVTVPSH
jgi:hypothetical protein